MNQRSLAPRNWLVHPIALLRSLLRGWRICQDWSDVGQFLSWQYSNKAFVPRFAGTFRRIKFKLPPPIDKAVLAVRDNRGADAFVFGEVLERLDYDVPVISPATILDLGANVGFASLFFAKNWPAARIACVEPMPANVAMLKSNLEWNGVSATVFQAAVAIEDGVIGMVLAGNDYGNKVVGIPFGKNLAGDLVEVEALSIPTLMSRLGWPRISLLKADIEGYEGILLKQNCDWLNLVDALCIECHEGFSENDLRAVADQYGFSRPDRPTGGVLFMCRPGIRRDGKHVA